MCTTAIYSYSFLQKLIKGADSSPILAALKDHYSKWMKTEGGYIRYSGWDVYNDTTYNRAYHLKNDGTVSFLPKGKHGEYITSYMSDPSKDARYADNNRQITTIGKALRHLCKHFSIEFKDKEIEEAVNILKGLADDSADKPVREIRIVKGEEITHWYDEANHAKTGCGATGSCMKYSWKGKYMEIYEKNDNISMAIVVDSDNKLVARALIWKTEKMTFMDRRYANPVEDQLLVSYAKAQGWAYRKEENDFYLPPKYDAIAGGFDIPLQHTEFDWYPYVDTFKYLYQDRVAMVYADDGDANYIGKMRSQLGGLEKFSGMEGEEADPDDDNEDEDDNTFECAGCGDIYDNDYSNYVDYMYKGERYEGDYCNDCATYAECGGGNYLNEHTVCLHDDAYCFIGDAVEYEDKWYHKDDMVTLERDGRVVPEDLIIWSDYSKQDELESECYEVPNGFTNDYIHKDDLEAAGYELKGDGEIAVKIEKKKKRPKKDGLVTPEANKRILVKHKKPPKIEWY